MTNPDDDRLAVELLIRGFAVSRTIRLVADLAIADRIELDTPCNILDLAAACGVLPQPLLRAARLLAAFGIFDVDAGGSVAHTARSLQLRTDVPNSLHYAARFRTAPGSWRAWEALDVALEGRTPHETAWGTRRFDYLRDHPAEARVFDSFMAHFPDERHNAVAAGYDFSNAALIADIGGGNGESLRRILARFPQRAWPRVRSRGCGGGGSARSARRRSHQLARRQLLRRSPGGSRHLSARPRAPRLAGR